MERKIIGIGLLENFFVELMDDFGLFLFFLSKDNKCSSVKFLFILVVNGWNYG